MAPQRALPVILAGLAGGMIAGAPAAADTASPVTAARIAALRVVVERHAAPQGRMLRCLMLVDPRNGELAAADWRKLLTTSAEAMTAARIPVEDPRSLLAPLTVEALTNSASHPTETRADCEARDDWQVRWATFMAHTFAGDVREVLTGRR